MEIKLIPKFNKVRFTPQTDWDVFSLGTTLQKNNLSYDINFELESKDIKYIEVDIYRLWAVLEEIKNERTII